MSLMPASSITTKSYLYLVSASVPSPHCIEKFFRIFGVPYWSSMWRELFFDINQPVINLSWKISHGVLYTAARLSSFGYDYNLS